MTGWDRALRVLSLLALDPGLKGLTVRARSGPVRARFEEACATLPLPLRRIHPAVSETQLFGGLDLVATLAEGRMVETEGLSHRPSALMLAMADRSTPHFAARLAGMLDSDAGHVLILLDEGAEPEETAPASLRERVAFEIDLSEVSWREAEAEPIIDPRVSLRSIRHDPEHAALMAATAARFGIDSLRAPLFAMRTARALAALEGKDAVEDTHLSEAAELVFAHRARHLPSDAEAEDSRPDTSEDEADSDATPGHLPEDMLVEAVAARLPPHLLDRLEQGSARTAVSGSGAGARRTGNRRGRPLPSRPGRPDGRARIDLVGTLRNAAPFQALRHRAGSKVVIHHSDITLRRFEDRSDRLLVFVVDASGSAAMARMAEAKGAVELFLARAYSRRDHVALIAFRGTGAEVLLSPTRSLVRAKRGLAGLPGGGGTPLAAGLLSVVGIVAQARHHGLSPSIVLLTDGRGNVGLTGETGRDAARRDAEAVAARLRADTVPALVIDTSNRPGSEGAALSRWLGARYLALPRADARQVCDAVTG
ncbi:MAG: magnesium chelatase subunit D [Pseudooceanicola nanhaiensis]